MINYKSKQKEVTNMTFKHNVQKISVIQIDDTYLANLFGMCDGEEIFLENDMDDYIQEELVDGNIDESDMDDILQLQSIIREELKTSIKVKVEYNENLSER